MKKLEWTKARSSSDTYNCVEMAFLTDGHVLVRDSKDPNGPVLCFDREAWFGFVSAVQSGMYG